MQAKRSIKKPRAGGGKKIPCAIAALFIFTLMSTQFMSHFGASQRFVRQNHFGHNVLFTFSPQRSIGDVFGNISHFLVETVTAINLNQMFSFIEDGLGFGGLVWARNHPEPQAPTGFRFVRRENLVYDPAIFQEAAPTERPNLAMGEPVVYLFNSHTEERFLDYIGNVRDITFRMEEVFLANGIPVLMEERITHVWMNENWGPFQFIRSYDASRGFLEERFAQHPSLRFFFDIHRNSPVSVPWSTINGRDYATIMFVIGTDNVHWQDNQEVAREIIEMLEAKRPGITGGRPIHHAAGGLGSNGMFNQDFSANLQLIEIGDNLTPLHAAYNSAELLAEVLSEWIMKQDLGPAGN